MIRFVLVLPVVALLGCDELSESLDEIGLGDVTQIIEPPEPYQLFPLFQDGPNSWGPYADEDTGDDTGLIGDCGAEGVVLTLDPESTEEGTSWDVEGAVLTLLGLDGEYGVDAPEPGVLTLAPGTIVVDLAGLACVPTTAVVEAEVGCDVGCTVLSAWRDGVEVASDENAERGTATLSVESADGFDTLEIASSNADITSVTLY